MSNYLPTLHKNSKPSLGAVKQDKQLRKDKDFFRPTGTQIYVGGQGSGKTISAVYHLRRLKNRYPKSVIVTNLALNGLEPVTFTNEKELYDVLSSFDPTSQYVLFSDMEQLQLALVGVNNSKFGVIYLIDEIHLYFNALESKNIPMYVFTEISQQRKQRKCIIGTSQLFLRTAKPLREQCDNVIVCKTIGGVLTTQTAYDGMTLDQDYNGKLTGHKKRTGWFIQTPEIRNYYDTYQKVISGKDQYDLQKPMNLVLPKNLGRTLNGR